MASDEQTLDLDAAAGAQRPAATQSRAGERIGPYELVRLIGRGGVAQVYRARHEHPSQSERSFAIKLLLEQFDSRAEEASRLRREAYVLSLLSHPNIVRTFEASVEDGLPFIVMEYVDGKNLGALLARSVERGVTMPMAVALHIVAEVLAGLEAAHDLCDADDNPLGVVHRDIKPQNVFLSYNGAVKLGDFGVAGLTAQHVEPLGVRGTAGYFPPEQLDGVQPDQRGDIFSLGVVLFELVCRRQLFGGQNVLERIESNRRAEVPRPREIEPSVGPELEAVILRALQRDPGDRFTSAAEMRLALEPHAPRSPGVRLGVASIMRAAFDVELAEESAARRAHRARASGSEVVAAVSGRASAVANLRDAASGCGILLEDAADAEVVRSLRDVKALRAVVADVGDVDAESVAAAASAHVPPLPIVAWSPSLSVPAIDTAYRISAVDFLTPPVTAARLQTALSATAAGTVGRAPETSPAQPVGSRLLLITNDGAVLERLAGPLGAMGLRVEVAPDGSAALERTARASFHLYVCDASGEVLSTRLRAVAGMGTVPVLYLTDTGASPDGAARTAARPRIDSAAAVGAAVQQMLADTREGRSFKRYPAAMPVQLRYGGTWLAGRSVNLSRGGVLMECDRMFPMGAPLSVVVEVSGDEAPIMATARIVRVELSDQETPGARLGVELEIMPAQDEARYVRLVAELDEAARRKDALSGPR